jgi:ribosomal protein S18 acetylase RimI-like enzyme
MAIRPANPSDWSWIEPLLVERWGEARMVLGGESLAMADLPMLVAEPDAGALSYRLLPDGEAEIISLDARVPGTGVGSRLIAALTERLRVTGVRRITLTTTNDNLAALGFYQRRGFRLAAIRPGAVEAARRLKPVIPLIGENGIPIRDEIDLCLDL